MPQGLYVYCIIGTGEARNFGAIGVGGQRDPVTTIAYRDLSAVVSSVSMDRYVIGREAMLSHERVIEKVMADHAVLPVVFYTVAPNAEEVRSLLRSRYVEFKSLLRDLDHKVELGLKAVWKDIEDILSTAMKETATELPSSSIKDARLALQNRKAKVTEQLLEPLKPVAVDLRMHRTYGDDMIMNVTFLVDQRREREFDAHVEALASTFSNSIEFKYVGPTPPYSFVSIVIKGDNEVSQRLGKEE